MFICLVLYLFYIKFILRINKRKKYDLSINPHLNDN